jgi:hypothetical protein
MKTQTITMPAADLAPARPRAALPARIVDPGRVRFGAGVGIMPRSRG